MIMTKIQQGFFKHLHLNHRGKIIIGHLNINSIKNKFDLLKEMVKKEVDLLTIPETKHLHN